MEQNIRWVAVPNSEAFLQMIELHSAGMEKALELYEAGKIEEAVHAVAAVYHARLASYPLPTVTRLNDPAKIMEIAENLMENKVELLGYPPEFVGDPIDWCHFVNGDRQWESHLGYFYFTEHLLYAYGQTKDIKYINKWNEYHYSFLERHPWGKKDKDLWYSKKLPMYENEYLPVLGGEGFSAEYIGGSWLSLTSTSRVGTWIEEMTYMEHFGVLDDSMMLNLIASLMGEHYYCMLNAPRKGTPNQFIHVSSGLIHLGVTFWEFKNAPAAYLVGMDRLEEAITKCVFDDGTDCEQCPGYNSGLPAGFYAIEQGCHLENNVRLSRLRKMIVKRCEYLALIMDPMGMYPSISKCHHTGSRIPSLRKYFEMYPEATLVKQIADAWESQKEPEGLPHSADMPYGGFSVIRDDWSRDSRYLLMKYSRWSPGHKHEDGNAVVLTAYGREMLIDTGNFNYSGDPESQRLHEYFYASYGHNTMDIDGLSQRKLALEKSLKVNERTPDMTDNQTEYQKLQDVLALHKTPCDGVRYHNDHFDFIEGYYHYGYQKKSVEIGDVDFVGEILEGLHKRQVIYVRGCAFVIIDRISADDANEHTFRQYWHYSGEYLPAMFAIEGGHAETKDEKGANLSLWSFAPDGMRLSTEYGMDSPLCRGWETINYGERRPSVTLINTWQGKGEQIAVTLLYPHQGTEELAKVTGNNQSLSADFGNGVAFDVVLDGEAVTVEERIAGGGAYTLRFDGKQVK